MRIHSTTLAGALALLVTAVAVPFKRSTFATVPYRREVETQASAALIKRIVEENYGDHHYHHSADGESDVVLKPHHRPHRHGNHDMSHLDPCRDSSTSYTPDGSDVDYNIAHIFAQINATYNYPSVMLPDTPYVSSIDCNDSGFVIDFNNTEAYTYVKAHWDAEDDFLLITESLACTNNTEGMHVYWFVDRLVFNDGPMTVTVVAQEIGIEDAAKGFHVVWGQWVPTDSGSNATETSAACLVIPETYKGLPTAPCGEDFDIALDAEIEYYDFGTDHENEQTWAEFFGESSSTNSTGPSKRWNPNPRFVPGSGRHFRKRNFFKDAGRRALDALKATGDRIKTAGEKAVEVVKVVAVKTVELAVDLKDNAKKIVKPSFKSTFPISVKPGTQVDSAFGKGNSVLLWEKEKPKKEDAKVEAKVALYCVDCGVTGTATMSGELDYTMIPPRITTAWATISGSLAASANLGLAAEASYKHEYQKNIITKAIPKLGVTVPNIMVVGAFVKVDAVAEFELKAEGQVLVGATMTIPNFHARLDGMTARGSELRGFEPQWKKNLWAKAQIEASLGLSLPVSIGVGIQAKPINLDKSIALKNTPKLTGTITAKFDSNLTNKEDCANGVEFNVGASYNLTIDVLKLQTFILYNKTFPPLHKGCYQPGKGYQVQKEEEDKKSRRSISHMPHNRRDDTAAADEEEEDDDDDDDDWEYLDYATNTTVWDEEALSALNESLTDSDDGAMDDAQGVTYISIVDSSGEWVLANLPDGNLYLTDINNKAGFMFASEDEMVYGDGSEYLFFYYPDEMATLSVSRLRMNDIEHIPKTAEMAVLVPINFDDNASTPGFYAVLTPADVYYMVFCSFENIEGKIFIVKDDDGLETLLKEELQPVITGGKVHSCEYIGLMSTGPGF